MDFELHIKELEKKYNVRINHSEIKNLAPPHKPTVTGYEFNVCLYNRIGNIQKFKREVTAYSKVSSLYNSEYISPEIINNILIFSGNVSYLELILEVAKNNYIDNKTL